MTQLRDPHTLAPEDRAQLNALALRGLHGAALAAERLLASGETVLAVTIAGPGIRIDILPPRRSSPLWQDAGTYITTEQSVAFFTRYRGAQVVWTLTKDEAARRGIAWRLH